MITATITGMHVRTKGRINPMEVHERIQLTTGINTCPVCVWGGGKNQSGSKINTTDAPTLNLIGGVLEAEPTKGLS
jgi:hypothetical protein